MCVCCMCGEVMYGRGAQVATRQSLQSLLPVLVTQELSAMSMVWSQVTFPAKHSAPGPMGIPDCCDLSCCWLWKEGLPQPDHLQVSLLQDDGEPCWMHSSLQKRRTQHLLPWL